MRNTIVVTVMLVLLAGCGAVGVTDGGEPEAAANADPAHELRGACLQSGGEWLDAETLEQDLETARAEEAKAAATAEMTKHGASDQFMRAPPPSQMADEVGNLRNNRAYRARERERLQAAIDSAQTWRIRAQEARDKVENIEELLNEEPLGHCERG